jgi:hypothetical protein
MPTPSKVKAPKKSPAKKTMGKAKTRSITKQPIAKQSKKQVKAPSKATSKASKETTIEGVSSQPRLEKLLKETEAELLELQPKIERLEKEMEKLRVLRHQKQKLITLKLSLQSILENFQLDETAADYLDADYLDSGATGLSSSYLPSVLAMPSFLPQRTATSHTPYKMTPRQGDPYQDMTFYPDVAMEEAEQLLKQKGSLNYELFRSIVLHGGRATTQDIRQFLIDHEIVQPGTGISFEETPLTDISSRVNYLIRKDLVTSIGRGRFASKLGWK